MTAQLKLDFSSTPSIIDGKKEHRISIAGSEEFKHIVELISAKFKTSASEYCYEAVVEKLQKDFGTIFLMQPNLNKPLREILEKFS